MVPNRIFTGLLAVALLVVAGLLPSFARSTSAQATVTTQARVIHAAANEGAIKVSFDGDTKIEDLNHGETSDFVEIDPGDLWVEIEEDGLDITDYIFSVVYPVVQAGNNYQLVLTDDVVLTQLVDITQIPAGKARLRLIQASVETPTLDVVATGSDLVLLRDARYPFATDYVEVDPGTYDLQLVQSGTTTVLLEVPGLTIAEGMVYDLVVAGTPGDEETPLQVITATAQATT